MNRDGRHTARRREAGPELMAEASHKGVKNPVSGFVRVLDKCMRTC